MTNPRLRVKRGFSAHSDEDAAAAELGAALSLSGVALTLVFASARYDLDRLARHLRERLRGPVIGCTAAGVLTPDGDYDHAVAGIALASDALSVHLELIEDAGRFDRERAEALAAVLAAHRGRAIERHPSAHDFIAMLLDGTCIAEERVAAHLHLATRGTPIIGGSAADRGALSGAHVYWDGGFHTGAAVLAHVVTPHPFVIVHDHRVIPGSHRVVVTGAVPGRRIVTQLNGRPASREYARLIGVAPDALGPAVFARHPLALRVGDEHYVRAIAGADADGALAFFSVVDVGQVLRLARPAAIGDPLGVRLADASRRVVRPRAMLAFECIARRAGRVAPEHREAAVTAMQDHSVIGFFGYGVQYNALHLNQAMVALALGE